MAENPTERELVFTRSFKAPPSVVFKAWTDPRHVAQWWGPRGFTNPVCELDVRQGGAIRIDMRGPDGTVYPMTGAYREIVEPERLVFTSAALDEKGRPLFEVLNYKEIVKPGRLTYLHESGPKFHATATFDEHRGKTTVTMRMLFDTAGERDRTVKVFGALEGAKQTLERLNQHVAKMGEE
jgi:uncharacterized protein YndB with AHSA1/START domain